MIDKFIRLLFNIRESKFRNDDDFTDRQSRRHMVSLLLLFALVITAKQYVGDPIQCWCPATFTDSHKGYAKSICWVKNTYYVPFTDPIPQPEDLKGEEKLSYYQWVPLILIAQAMICYFPSLVWRCFYRRSGLNICAIIDSAITGQRTPYQDVREKTTRHIVHMLDRYLTARSRRTGCWNAVKQRCADWGCPFYGRSYGNYLWVSYIITKLLYCVLACLQLALLDTFLGDNFNLYGFKSIVKLFFGKDWLFSPRFPRVTMCDFEVRHQTAIHKYIVQCVLPINLFNEKIFLIIWFAFMFLCICSFYGLLRWLIHMFCFRKRAKYIRGKLKFAGIPMKGKREVIEKFTKNYLRKDGVFVIKLISDNVGNLVASEVLEGLWENFGPERHLVRHGGAGMSLQPGRGIQVSRLAEGLGEV